MTIRNVTITSKNQITIPADYVKKLGLKHNRFLTAEFKKGQIILTPAPTLSELMRPIWDKYPAKVALSDAELRQAARQAATEKFR